MATLLLALEDRDPDGISSRSLIYGTLAGLVSFLKDTVPRHRRT